MSTKHREPKKLVIDDVVIAPETKVKLYDKIGAARAKLILEDPEELVRLKRELEAAKAGVGG